MRYKYYIFSHCPFTQNPLHSRTLCLRLCFCLCLSFSLCFVHFNQKPQIFPNDLCLPLSPVWSKILKRTQNRIYIWQQKKILCNRNQKQATTLNLLMSFHVHQHRISVGHRQLEMNNVILLQHLHYIFHRLVHNTSR